MGSEKRDRVNPQELSVISCIQARRFPIVEVAMQHNVLLESGRETDAKTCKNLSRRISGPRFPARQPQAGYFTSEVDLAVYAHWLAQGAERFDAVVHSWVFMTNHVHLLDKVHLCANTVLVLGSE